MKPLPASVSKLAQAYYLFNQCAVCKLSKATKLKIVFNGTSKT